MANEIDSRAGRTVTKKIFAILETFSPANPAQTLSELARRAGMELSTAHRRVAELVEWGALERGADGRYRIGLRLWEVATLAPRGVALREAALPFMEDLYEVTHENVQLAVREGLELVFVERIAGRHAVPVLTRVGGRFHLHATGVGLVLLGHAPAEIQEEILRGSLHRYTTKTVTDPIKLRQILAAIRKNGYAVSDGQVTLETLSVAAPVVDGSGDTIAAVSLVVPAQDAQVPTLAALVRTTARGISRTLGQREHGAG